MIRLTRLRTANGLPRDFTGARLLEKHQDLVTRFFSGQAEPPIKWTSSKWKSAKKRLRFESGGKCAYCEASTDVVAHGDVEHFRPKSKYWWLAYDFDNYVFACQICNQIYKGDNFPISGQLLGAPVMPNAQPSDAQLTQLVQTLVRDVTSTTDEELIAVWGLEEADLIHPYLEDPSDLLAYEADDANREVWIRAGEGVRALRAHDAAVKFLGLNREELRRLRYKQLEILRILKLSFDEPRVAEDTKAAIWAQFREMSQPAYPFAGLNRFFLRLWNMS
ncbi:HNH endonuclease [Agrobacterium deltaense]